ncbi:hypothetical protein Glove_109g387 [Diversispora epigaea]|uniref:Uncharacterized protein n=1 Tax=Diversispora epigaea TaxID=1348612 RepID=A0A397JBH5_9GLOM|nr:hypothetical protein Glove_109g387 [Diversispora epigaea]
MLNNSIVNGDIKNRFGTYKVKWIDGPIEKWDIENYRMVKTISQYTKVCIGAFLYPIRIGWQTVFEQNKRQFYMHITEGHETNETQPGYRCTSGSKYTITSLYQRLFRTPLILGWDNEELLETSLKDVYFRAFGFKVEKFLIYVTNIGIGNNTNMMGLQKLYPSDYILDDRELRVWRTMLKAVGCYEFWSRNENSIIDQNILQDLYNNGFLQAIPKYINNVSKEFWKVFSKIIAKAQTYCNINGPGCPMLNKPIITRVRITEEMKKQFEKFFSDKNIVNLSSYRVDKNGLPLKYLKDKKETLWKNYFELYPDGMKRTTFLTKL